MAHKGTKVQAFPKSRWDINFPLENPKKKGKINWSCPAYSISTEKVLLEAQNKEKQLNSALHPNHHRTLKLNFFSHQTNQNSSSEKNTGYSYTHTTNTFIKSHNKVIELKLQ